MQSRLRIQNCEGERREVSAVGKNKKIRGRAEGFESKITEIPIRMHSSRGSVGGQSQASGTSTKYDKVLPRYLDKKVKKKADEKMLNSPLMNLLEFFLGINV